MVLREIQQPQKRLVSLGEDDCILLCAVSLVQQFQLHLESFALGLSPGGATYSLTLSCEDPKIVAIPTQANM